MHCPLLGLCWSGLPSCPHLSLSLSSGDQTSHNHSTSSRLINTVTVVNLLDPDGPLEHIQAGDTHIYTTELNCWMEMYSWSCNVILYILYTGNHNSDSHHHKELFFLQWWPVKLFPNARLMNGFSIADNNEQTSQCLILHVWLCSPAQTPTEHEDRLLPNEISHSGFTKAFSCIQRIQFY